MACCCSASTGSCCSGVSIPKLLNCNITISGGTCACLNSVDVALAYAGLVNIGGTNYITWQGSVVCGSETALIQFYCFTGSGGPVFKLNFTCPGGSTFGINGTNTCSPLDMVFQVGGGLSCGNCSATGITTFTVTP